MLNLVSAIFREEICSRRESFSKVLCLRRYVTFSIEKGSLKSIEVCLPEQTFKCIGLLNQMITFTL